MPESPPRLDSADPGAQPGYAPISWTAVVALALAVVFAVLLAVILILAFLRGQQAIESWLFFFPAVVLVLVFVARRQIRASEGTRVGERYANAAWWIAVVSGLTYIAYLGAIEFAIRNQADSEFNTWAKYLKELNPRDPKDPNFFQAAHMTLDPGVRESVPASDAAQMENTFQLPVLAVRSSDVVQICARNPGAVEFRTHGLQQWEQKPNEVSCTLTATLATPEGQHELVVPMRAVIDERTKARRWQIVPSPTGYVNSRALSPYGWQVDYLQGTAQQFSQEFLSRLSNAGQSRYAYYAFIHPDFDVTKASALFSAVPALVGPSATFQMPYPPGGEKYLNEKVFSRPGGEPLNPTDLARFTALWNTPTRLIPAGNLVKTNPDTKPRLLLDENSAECRVPIEIQLGGMTGGPGASIARGALILRVTRQDDPAFFDALAARRAEGAAAGLTATPPQDADYLKKLVPWRVVRIESDLRPLSAAERGEPAMPGMPGM